MQRLLPRPCQEKSCCNYARQLCRERRIGRTCIKASTVLRPSGCLLAVPLHGVHDFVGLTCSKPRNLMMLRDTLGWKRRPPL